MCKFLIMQKFALRHMPLLSAVGLLIISQACTGSLGSVHPAKEPKPRVSISALDKIAAESYKTRLRIERDVFEGDLLVIFSVSGDAVWDMDYKIRGADFSDASKVLITIPGGQTFTELVLEVEDDLSAEAAETITLTLQATEEYSIDKSASSVTVRIPQNDFSVTTAADSGEGSLRQAIINANALAGPNTIRFDSKIGPFATPQTIVLESELPDLVDELVIDGYIEDRLWKPSGVTVSGGSKHHVFIVAPGAKVTINYLTIADGRATEGAGIANRGELVVKSVTFTGNTADYDGGGIANLGGFVTVINSTFANNTAGDAGGGLADIGGTATVTNCTFSENIAKEGGGLFSSGTLLLRNTILANSEAGSDCLAAGGLDPLSTNNIIEENNGCGDSIIKSDPRLEKLGGYNGPTPTIPLGGGSPAINLGDNASAVDENGKPLRWDQRGNGDPRFVAGITDIGAFEVQRFPSLIVDTFDDKILRACTPSGPPDCSLRGAITLANATSKPDVISFDSKVFGIPRTIVLKRPLPDLATDMTIDASGTAGVTVSADGGFTVFNVAQDAEVQLVNITVEENK